MNYERRFGAYIRAERLKSGMKYADFARKLGISHTTLSRLENSAQSVTLRTLQVILQRLNASLTDIFGRDEVNRLPAWRMRRLTGSPCYVDAVKHGKSGGGKYRRCGERAGSRLMVDFQRAVLGLGSGRLRPQVEAVKRTLLDCKVSFTLRPREKAGKTWPKI